MRFTIKELEEKSDIDMLLCIIAERKSDCTNIYSPLYKRLCMLGNKLENEQILTTDDFNPEFVKWYESMKTDHSLQLQFKGAIEKDPDNGRSFKAFCAKYYKYCVDV